MSGFRAALVASGLRPRDIVADGRIRRCSTDTKPGRRNGWYVLHADGHGAWGDWTSGGGEALGHWAAEVASSRPVDTARMRTQRERERERRLHAIRGAREFWRCARPLRGLHPYLERKSLTLQGCAALRQVGDLLVVPVMWQGRLISVQTIAIDGTKRFWPGAPVKAGSCTFDRQRAAITALVEGVATGLAVFQAVRQARVIVAFDAGNLLPVLDLLRPSGSVVIAADNDHRTQVQRGFNPGREKALSAAELIDCGVAWPEGIEGTDWADYLLEMGEGAQRKAERLITAAARYVATPS